MCACSASCLLGRCYLELVRLGLITVASIRKVRDGVFGPSVEVASQVMLWKGLPSCPAISIPVSAASGCLATCFPI